MREIEIHSKIYLVDRDDRLLKRSGVGYRKMFKNKDGYMNYTFSCRKRGTFNLYVHKFIWELHNGAVPEGLTVDHIDDNRLNNEISNLQLLSFKDNVVKGKALNYLVTKPCGLQVEVYNLEAFTREIGFRRGVLHKVARGELKSYHGWKAIRN